jgi:hypothetical protein
MKLSRRIAVVVLAFLSATGFLASMCSFWYLWYLASRVSDPSRGLVHPRLLGDRDLGTEFTVYLTSAESALVSPGLYLAFSGAALLLLGSLVSWRFPIRRHET